MIDLAHTWADTWAGLALTPPSGELLHDLCRRYAEPHRRYHTLQHLSECLSLSAQDSALAEQPAEVALALWFHDAIHEPGRSDNEAASAAWAQASLQAAGAEPARAQRVHALVMATRHRELPQASDAQLVVDIDLAILGAPTARFEEYEQQIRAEYAHVPGLIFRAKRRAVLKSFLDREFIYSTASYRDRFESAARSNLQRAIAG